MLFGLPAVTVGIVAERERRARGEVERLNAEVTGTLNRLQATQQELLVAERMATVGRLSLKVAHEVRNPIAAIELNAEMLQDIVRGHPGADMDEATGLVAAIRDQVTTLDALTEEYLAFARFPKPHFEDESINHLLEELAAFVRPVATRQGLTIHVATDPGVPMMEIDRALLRQAIYNLVKNAMEALSRGGALTIESRLRRRCRRDRGLGHRRRPHAGGRSAPVRAVLHDQAAGDGAGAVDHAPDHRGARRRSRLAEPRGRRRHLHHPPAGQEAGEPCLNPPRCWWPTTIPDCARASIAR